MIRQLYLYMHDKGTWMLLGIGAYSTITAAIEHNVHTFTINGAIGFVATIVALFNGLRTAYKNDRKFIIKYVVDIPQKHYRYILVQIKLCKDYILNIKKKQ